MVPSSDLFANIHCNSSEPGPRHAGVTSAFQTPQRVSNMTVQHPTEKAVNALPAGRVERAEAKLGTAERKIMSLEREVSHLKRREGRYKDRLEAKGESLKDALGEAQEARTQAVMAEERIDTLEALLGAVRNDLIRYKGWWLTEYHSMKVIIALLPDPDYVHDIAMSSKARFETYSASL